MSQIKNFFTGRVSFIVNGLPVTCLNKLRQFQISDIKVLKDGLTFKVPLVHATAVRKLVNNFDWQMQENYNFFRGINFLLNNFFLVCLLSVAILAYFVTDMGIYDVKIVGVNAELTEKVNEYLANNNVKKFMWKWQVDKINIPENLVTSFPEIAHANVKIAGNTLLINLSTATYHCEKVKTNIVSRYNAVIKEVFIYSGIALVKPGDVVHKGEILVEGAYTDSVAIVGEVAFRTEGQIIRLDISII